MDIAVAGAICYDENISPSGEVLTGFGGIMYNLAAFASLAGNDDRVVPVSNVGQDRFEDVCTVLQTLPHVDLSGMRCCSEPLTHVTLRWKDAADRDETIRHRMPPVTLEMLSEVLACDALHVNFVNVRDVELDTIGAFRRSFSGLISLDVHQLPARFDAEGNRALGPFPAWREWAACVDVWQCNESELAALFPGMALAREAVMRAAAEICQAGPRVVCVTLGSQGAVMVHRNAGRYYGIDAIGTPGFPVVDTTGCGDSFSAGLVMGLLRFRDPVQALALAILTAALNAGQCGLAQLRGIEAYASEPRRYVPAFAGQPGDWLGDLLF